MATLDQILEIVTNETTQIDSISALLTGLKKQLDDALAGTVLPVAVQAKIDAVFSAAEGNLTKLANALNANVPVPPAPPEPPAPVPEPPAPA